MEVSLDWLHCSLLLTAAGPQRESGQSEQSALNQSQLAHGREFYTMVNNPDAQRKFKPKPQYN